MKNNLEDQYWKQIKKLKWEEDHDYKRIEQYLKDNFTVSEAIRLNDFVSEKVNQLYTKYESDWLAEPGISVSDDGWSDLLNEVVGRGKEFYENIDVECLQDMADHNDYEESFSYCFHFTYDLQRQEAQTPPPLQYLLISQDQGDKTQIKKEWFKDKSAAEEKRKQLRAKYFDVIIVSEEQAVAIKDGEQIVLHIVNR